jgi:hypothetical protein
VEGSRFDRLTRALATEAPRRTVLLGALAGLIGGIGRGANEAGAACANLNKPCSQASDCCSGYCTGGKCSCAPGNEPCGATTCTPVCPPDQFRGSGCRCLCRATGRPPGPTGCPCTASSVCDGGEIVFCGGTSLDCLCDSTTSGSLVCSDFYAFPEIPCATNADCPANHSCVTSFDCAQPYCALACGVPSAARRLGGPTRDRSDGPVS